jgi:hypothetical protein
MPQVLEITSRIRRVILKLEIRLSRGMVAALILISTILVSAGVLLIIDTSNRISQDHSSALPVWSEWGMSINYPPGAKTILSTTSSGGPNSAEGQVAWFWNDSFTSLSLVWQNVTQYDYQELYVLTFNSTYDKLMGISSNVTSTGKATLVFDNVSWLYVNYRFVYQNQTLFATFAYTYFPSSHRIYGLAAEDLKPDTLNILMEYGMTFRG